MTVNTTMNKISYIGNGIATTFAIPFPFLEKSYLKVYQLLNDIQTERTDWTVSDGNLIFATAPAINAQIVIIREVPLTQETDYRENEILAADTLESNFDKLTMQIQQLKEQTDRAVTVDLFDNTQAADLLPSIRRSVSNAASYAQSASDYADNAALSATTATEQANVAIQQAAEAINSIATFQSHIEEINDLKSAENFTSAGKAKIVEYSFPSKTYTTLTATNGGRYTAPECGYYYIEVMNANSNAIFTFDDGRMEQILGNATTSARGKISVRKNDSFVLTANNAIVNFRFYPCNI